MYKHHFLQTAAWAKVRSQQPGWQAQPVGDNWLLTKLMPLGKRMGYMPQVNLAELNWEELHSAGQVAGLTHILLDPHDLRSAYQIPKQVKRKYRLIKTSPLYYRHTTVLELSKSTDELLAAMKPKTRYNLRLAQKKGVKVEVSDSPEAYQIFSDLFWQTVQRQRYFARDKAYYDNIWQTLLQTNQVQIAIAYFDQIPLVAWMLFLDPEHKVMYYPYGGSSEQFREVMAGYALVWEIIEWGKAQGYEWFDLWGTLGPNPDSRSPEFGFHRFKLGFGGEEIEFFPSYDLVLKPLWYWAFRLANFARWAWLRMRR